MGGGQGGGITRVERIGCSSKLVQKLTVEIWKQSRLGAVSVGRRMDAEKY